ncbi:MAG TPA: LysR family transcriptional regulator, partial [Polyangia bacterium]
MRWAPHPVTLRQLQYLCAVAETRSFRRAAALCHVAQPSLSSQLAAAERALGVRVFERDRRRVLVTAAGAALLERARALVVAADDLADAAARLADPFAGTLRIGVIPTIAPYLLPAIAPALKRALPKLRVLWSEDKTAALAAALHA